MAENVTHDISNALFRFMCLNIVGTEDHVKTIRFMNAVRDDLSSDEDTTIITSGSYGEGLEMRGSDLDIMFVDKRIKVDEDEKPRLNPNVPIITMKTDDVKPGYTQLEVEYNRDQYFSKCCEELNGKHYISSTLFKQQFLIGKNVTIHGPCISDNEGLLDYAICVHCKTWVSQATHWITRSNNSWPSNDVKHNILKHGVLFVAIGVKGSPKEDLEWRISFSVGEKLLINTFTHTQLICYALLKIILKDVIATDPECEDLLSSYFLKTIIFWISEEIPQCVWKPENLITCFMRCFRRLIYSVEYSVCMHYFIPGNNMFENKIEGQSREMLLKKLYSLNKDSWRCILFSDQLSSFHYSMFSQIEAYTLHLRGIENILNSNNLYKANISFDALRARQNRNISNRGIHHTISCNDFLTKCMYAHYMSRSCSLHVQFNLLIDKYSSNKCQYKQCKSYLCTLLQNINHDAVSGWLMLASFFYKTKQYTKALRIIEYSVTKCTLEKLYPFMVMSETHQQLFKYESLQQKSIVHLWKLLLVDFTCFEQNSLLIPDELHIEVDGRPFFSSSSVYVYFLSFLCHYHLNNIRQYHDSLSNLRTVISENYLIADLEMIASTYDLLGVALQVLGDTESARRAFSQSVELYQDPFDNPAKKRLLSIS